MYFPGFSSTLAEILAEMPISMLNLDSTMQTGKIFDIKKYALHDGPGIRTTIFFKGCPLACWWCHNPESVAGESQRIYRKNRCIGCRQCADACPQDAIQPGAHGLQWNPSECVYCGSCARICPAEAVALIGKTVSVDDVMTEIAKDTVFYDQSSGGITISGGEPLMQPLFLMDLLDACGKLGFHRTVDTCGYADTQILLEASSRTDLFLYDLKHMDAEKHIKYTGVSNEKILANLEILSRRDAEIIIRFPLIPGLNSDTENVDRTGAFVSSLPGVNRINILPYHRAATAKYDNLGLKLHTNHIAASSKELTESVAARLENYGLTVKIGG